VGIVYKDSADNSSFGRHWKKKTKKNFRKFICKMSVLGP